MVYAIIVTFNPVGGLHNLLESMKNQVDHILVIDNGSERKEFLRNESDWSEFVEFIYNTHNKGLALALNQGIRAATDRGATHVVLLDQDTLPDENMVSDLLCDERRLAEEGKNVAAVGPRLIDIQTRKTIPFIRSTGWVRERIYTSPCGSPVLVDHVITSGMLIPVKAFKNVGLMWESLFIDYIDVEWCFRARSKGYAVFGSSTATLYHDIGEKRFSILMLKRQVPVHHPNRIFFLFRNLCGCLASPVYN